MRLIPRDVVFNPVIWSKCVRVASAATARLYLRDGVGI